MSGSRGPALKKQVPVNNSRKKAPRTFKLYRMVSREELMSAIVLGPTGSKVKFKGTWSFKMVSNKLTQEQLLSGSSNFTGGFGMRSR